MKLTGFARKKVELMERISLLENVNNRQAEVLQEELMKIKEQIDEWRLHSRYAATCIWIDCGVWCCSTRNWIIPSMCSIVSLVVNLIQIDNIYLIHLVFDG